MEDFTPVAGLIGGLLIGLAVTLLLLMNGRLAGISGIVGGLLARGTPGIGWRWSFVLGLVIGASGYVLLSDGPVPVKLESSLPVLVAAGLLVGFGTRLGSGCTSGHGLCGLSRLSRRSVAATATFFGVAMLTVFLVRHVL